MKCPGQDSRYWKPGAIFDAECPECGKTVEFFKDDTTRKCNDCGHRFVNPNMDFGCAAYCKFAEQCIGTLPEEVLRQRDQFLKDRVAIEMKKYFKRDFKRIGHASRVARHAEDIAKDEQGDLAVVLTAAYLHDIGFPTSIQKYSDAAKDHHEEESAIVARSILEKLDAKRELIDEVCTIIDHHHHPKADDSLNFKIVYDADVLSNIEEKLKTEGMNISSDDLENRLFTSTGKDKLRRIIDAA